MPSSWSPALTPNNYPHCQGRKERRTHCLLNGSSLAITWSPWNAFLSGHHLTFSKNPIMWHVPPGVTLYLLSDHPASRPRSKLENFSNNSRKTELTTLSFGQSFDSSMGFFFSILKKLLENVSLPEVLLSQEYRGKIQREHPRIHTFLSYVTLESGIISQLFVP